MNFFSYDRHDRYNDMETRLKALSICINQNLPVGSLRTHIFRLVLSLAGSGIYLSPERHVISSKLELNFD